MRKPSPAPRTATPRLPLTLLLLLLASLADIPAHAVGERELPALGDAASGIVSAQAEQRLGSAWLRQLRAQTQPFYDPLVNEYIEHLAYRLAAHSDLVEPRLSIVLLNSTAINAFAVPGGVLGANAGLLLHAEREDELAGVVAHELAHLSQRHYARSLEQQQRAQPLALSALLASILVAATVGGDAGAAAVIGTQAGLAQQQLAHSRDHERESDRIGMQTLVRAGFDPVAMPDFFARMMQAMPLDPEQYPEYIRTHPLTESRISDARNRAQQLPATGARTGSADFTLARARVQVAFVRDPGQAAKEYADALARAPGARQPYLRFALALAQLRNHLPEDALATLALLREAEPERIAYRVVAGEALVEARRPGDAARLLVEGLAVAPDNFPLAMGAANALLLSRQPARAAALLERQAILRRDDPNVWQLLARARGEMDDRVGVHAARAEFLFLTGQPDPAREQLKLGIGKAGDRFALAAPLRNRLHEMDETRDDFRP